ncbi:MAG: 3-dehydroquinate synthase [Prevotella sp.]|nr:3-dehydroquinate synthase [Prevotella sp.]MDY2702835.1 3-dehydroquinate synthase [Prevotella sp.]
MNQRVIITENIKSELAIALSESDHDRLFVLVDECTKEKCWNKIKVFYSLKNAHVITIKPSDSNKTLESISHVWKELGNNGGTRHSCLVNLGGGMVTDLGGFAASTFKRGINFINIPTTLLSMVDASVGGKTGINFNGLKNEIGTFCNANFVLLCTDFLTTLDSANLLSGYAEMLKHGLISNIDMLAGLLNFDVCHIQDKEQRLQLSRMISDSVEVKKNIVEKDPKENGIRKALNLGHTFGHAFESWSLKRTPVLHGYAVAWGLVCELYLSHVITGFPIDTMRQTVDYIRNHYGIPPVTCDDYHELIDLMRHDKKNRGESINFTLLAEVGDIRLDQHATLDIIKEAIDFLREG